MSTVYNAPVSSNEAAAILGTPTASKPTAKAIAAKVAARAKAVAAKVPASKPTAKAIDAKIDALLGHSKAKATKPAKASKPAATAKTPKARKAFQKYDAAFCAKVVAFVKGGKSFAEAKREFGCSSHWVSRLVKGE